MNLIDTHCHPQFPQYDQDRDEMIKRALDAGIQMICVGTDLEMSKKAIELAQRNAGIWASVGLHPNDQNNELRIMNYEELLGEPRVVAVGEVGLDYYRIPETEKQKRQREVFQEFLDLAIKHEKPLILHCRQAYGDTISILNSKFQIPDSKIGGVVHSYTGNLEEAKQFLNLGLYLGFNGIITFARQYDEVVKHVPLDRILLETDAPFLTPEPYRGQRNEPLYVIEVAKKIAELKGITVEEVAEQTTKNTETLFYL